MTLKEPRDATSRRRENRPELFFSLLELEARSFLLFCHVGGLLARAFRRFSPSNRAATCVSAIKDNDIFIIEINCRTVCARVCGTTGGLKFGPRSPG